MLVYSKQYSPVFNIPRQLEHHQANQRIFGQAGDDLSNLEVLVREPNSCRILSNRNQRAPNMKKYLPRLESNERVRSNDIKRSCNVNLTRQRPHLPPTSTTVRLPGIVPPTRKSSISDSTNTTSTSSIPSIEITEPGAVSREELIIPFQGDHFFKSAGKNPFQMLSRNSEAGESRIISVPRPPRSPRVIDANFATNKRFFHNSRRNFKRSQHFELTLQNIEEVKDTENESSSTFGKRGTSSLIGERDGAEPQPGVEQLVAGHHRSHSTPVDYRELRNKIEATRLVNMGDMSGEFTKHYLSGKGNEDEQSEADIRNRCIDWLKSLNFS